MINIVDEFKNLLKGIGFVAVLLFVIFYLKLNAIQTFCLLISIQVVMRIINLFKGRDFDFKGLLKSIIYIAIIMTILRTLEKYGVIGFILAITIIVGSILYRRWDKYVEVKQYIESMIWGEPLYKFRERGEKPPKLKFRWKEMSMVRKKGLKSYIYALTMLYRKTNKLISI